MAEARGSFSVSVSRKLCIGCNLCCEVAEEVFFISGDKSDVKKNADLKDVSVQDKIVLACQACPVLAIKIK